MSILAISGAIAGGAVPAAARCGDDPMDAAAIAGVREAIGMQCNCATASSHVAYVSCAQGVISAAVGAGSLPSACAASVKRCATKSICGRKPGAVTCCRTTASGKVKCTIKSEASKCRASVGGSACVGAFTSCCDACNSSGCAPTATPTVTATPTITPTFTATPTVPALCQSLVGLPSIAQVPITLGQGSSVCGGAGLSNPAPEPPLAGDVQDGSGTTIGDLGLGCMYAGVLPGLTLPDGAVARVSVVGVNLLPPSVEVAGGGTDAHDCTRGAGPGASCADGAPGIDGQGTCASDADCSSLPGHCLPTLNCFFGPPIPLANGGLAACVMAGFLTDLCGRIDLLPVQATMAAALSARVYLTGNSESPCPRCLNNVCDSGDRAGMACTPVGSLETSTDCPPALGTFVTALTVVIPELTTGTSVKQSADGVFCPGQTLPGAFGLTAARQVSEQGVAPASAPSGPLDVTIAGTFCIPPTGTFIDTVAQLPTVGAISAPASVDLTGVIALP